MLSLNNIKKDYYVGQEKVEALKGVSILFRKSEFVSILGPSGCGKTTLLNIIGGLDRYTSGDLIINGKSTKDFKDKDWDTYRNHTIGFVFQSYNLIPHQSVLKNVELALTLTGVSKDERKKRAIEALEKVGLGNQLNKKPRQMSGGQMQRVAIARALVNNPDILLADEPTGALDSVTSVQIMDLLKEISKDKLIIMVTHNKELAETYSSRIISAKDGLILDDSNPYLLEDQEKDSQKELAKLALENEELTKNLTPKEIKKKKKKKSMSFFTALSLSLNNLMTKKGRTILTSFAGSIGIIGIALILSLSNGFQQYLTSVQEDTLSSYPLSINRNETDFNAFFQGMGSGGGGESHDLDKIYSNSNLTELMNSFAQVSRQNSSLSGLKASIDENHDKLSPHLSAITYSYGLDLQVYASDISNGVNKVNPSTIINILISAMGQQNNPFITASMYNTFGEIMPGLNEGEIVSPLIKNQYDMVAGEWPTESNQLVLIVNRQNEISDLTLYALGLKDQNDFLEFLENASKPNGNPNLDTSLTSWTFDEILDMEYKLVLPTDLYEKDMETGSYVDISKNETKMKMILNQNARTLEISGIIRPKPETTVGALSGSIGYTSLLMEQYIKDINNSKLVKDQIANPEINVLTGKPFAKFDDEVKADQVKTINGYLNSLSADEKYAFYKELYITPMPKEVSLQFEYAKSYITDPNHPENEALFREQYKENLRKATEHLDINIDKILERVDKMSIDQLLEEARPQIEDGLTTQIKKTRLESFMLLSKEQALLNLQDILANLNDKTDEEVKFTYDIYKTYREANDKDKSSYKSVLRTLGSVDVNDPASINFFPKTFEDKEFVENFIANYNDGVSDEERLIYNDYIGTFMSGVSLIIDAISYVLIGFVAISLVVSSIMIGIITYISVLERTKEIGILRSIGASKTDVKRVFNAETLIVGFVAGVFGIVITLILCIPLTLILQALSGVRNIAVILPPLGGLILVLISMLLTFLSGLIPASFAAKKDPVEALRTE